MLETTCDLILENCHIYYFKKYQLNFDVFELTIFINLLTGYLLDFQKLLDNFFRRALILGQHSGGGWGKGGKNNHGDIV